VIDFRSPDFLREHIQSILDFYAPNVVDPAGGFHQNYLDNGAVFDTGRKHLVSSCRMIFNYVLAQRLFGEDRYRDLWHRGLGFLRSSHWQPQRQGYVWTLDDQGATDETNHCYGLAFVLLAFASAVQAGDESARADVDQTWNILESRFWQPGCGLYADEISADWKVVSPYRGQNANMHCCEALLAAFEATGEERFLNRAYDLASKIVIELAAKSDGLVWEHYRQDLSIDWDYNRDNPKHLYRPWGFQAGHQTEWAKLLMILHRHRPEPWMLERATALFDRAMKVAWDEANGGLFYGFDPQGRICDSDKYFWVQAETFAAAALLAAATANEQYWQEYDRLWTYCWAHFVDHDNGAWFRILTAENGKVTDIKSEAGAKCDYHNLGACATVLEIIPPGSKLPTLTA
jgi:mannose/cellobiose epimerase-like protein (N-acyl-D-glucosamine 2-epimerase family)